MQQPCSRCGYISDRPARFCRQCGSQLYAENEMTSATTMNYSQQPPQIADQQPSGYAPGFSASGYSPGGWSEQTPNTSRLYQPPVVVQNQYPVAEQKKSFGWGKWILISFLIFLLLSVAAGGALFWWGKQVVEKAIANAGVESPGPAIVVNPPVPGEPPSPGAPAPESVAVTLDSLKYPGATVIEAHKAPFTEKLGLTTDDDIETVKQYYDKKFGETFKNSATNIQSQEGEKYVYVALSQPMITIEIEPDPKNDAKTRISVVKVSAPIPKFVLPKELRRN